MDNQTQPTRFRLVLATFAGLLVSGYWFYRDRLRPPHRWGPVSDCQRGYRGRSNAQSIQITHWSGGHACDLEGALPGMTIVSLTF